MKVLILTILTLLTSSYIEQNYLIKEFLDSYNENFREYDFYQDEINQYYFEDVIFYEIDTNSHISTGSNYSVLKVAVDDDNYIYKISGFNLDEYNKLVKKHPVVIDNHSVMLYGRFYLDLISTEYSNNKYYILNLDNFIKYSYSIMKDSINLHPQKIWETEKSKITQCLNKYDLNLIKYFPANSLFIMDYFIWSENDGNITKVSLSISEDGICEILDKDIICNDIGYWSKY